MCVLGWEVGVNFSSGCQDFKGGCGSDFIS